jgi:hypothetical protein
MDKKFTDLPANFRVMAVPEDEKALLRTFFFQNAYLFHFGF